MKLMLCGDVVPTAVSAAAFERGDVHAVFGGMEREFARADAVIVNLECALTDSDAAIRKCGPNLKGEPACAGTLRKAGVTHAGLSNNHVYDFGADGLEDTMRALEGEGIAWFGAGRDLVDSRRPLIIESKGMRAGVIAVCEHEYSYALEHAMGSAPFDPFVTPADVRRLRPDVDLLIVMYHGGKEQCQYPSPRLRRACRALVEAGADIVLTQHSHCIGCRESYMGGEIVYGQGNFCFAAHGDNPHWQSGLALEVDVHDGHKHLRYIPVMMAGEGIMPAPQAEADEILAGFEERSRLIEDEACCEKQWRAFCESVRAQYTAAARDAFAEGDQPRQIFGHYLDCEAHLDVWQTLFETWRRTDAVDR